MPEATLAARSRRLPCARAGRSASVGRLIGDRRHINGPRLRRGHDARRAARWNNRVFAELLGPPARQPELVAVRSPAGAAMFRYKTSIGRRLRARGLPGQKAEARMGLGRAQSDDAPRHAGLAPGQLRATNIAGSPAGMPASAICAPKPFETRLARFENALAAVQ